MKKSQDDVRRKEDELKKLRRRTSKEETELANDEVSIDLALLKDKISADVNQYLQIYKISTTLLDIIQAMIEN